MHISTITFAFLAAMMHVTFGNPIAKSDLVKRDIVSLLTNMREIHVWQNIVWLRGK